MLDNRFMIDEKQLFKDVKYLISVTQDKDGNPLTIQDPI